MTPEETRQWFREHGVELDDEGLPIIQASNRPPAPCMRCGSMVEGPSDVLLMRRGDMRNGPMCVQCLRLSMTNPHEFWDNWPLKTRFSLKLLAHTILRIIILSSSIIFALWLLRK
jgi:hypothetical protein